MKKKVYFINTGRFSRIVNFFYIHAGGVGEFFDTSNFVIFFIKKQFFGYLVVGQCKWQ